MKASPKEPNTNPTSGAIPENDLPSPMEGRTSELPSSTTNTEPPSGGGLLPPIIPQKAVDDGGAKRTIDTATASASPKESGERMPGLPSNNMTTMTTNRASSCPQGSFGTNAMATATRLPQTELQMREEILLLQEQQRLVEQEILHQRLLIAEQRQREGLELLALRGVGPSAAATTTGVNSHLPRSPEALQRELLKVEAEESRLKQMQLQLQRQQSPSILQLERELAMAEQAHAAEIMLRVRAEQAMKMRQANMPPGRQPRESISHPSSAAVISSTSLATTLSNPSPTKTVTTAKTKKKTKRASSATAKTSTKEGVKKKRKVGRPIGSSAKAKERSKQLADASRLFQTESLLLGMGELGPLDGFKMSPEMAASILGASKTPRNGGMVHVGLNAAPATAPAATVTAYPAVTGDAPANTGYWVDPTPNSTARSSFILPCSRQPSAALQAPTLDSYRSQWSAIQSSLKNDTRLSPNSRHREAIDQFLHDARFAGIPIQNDTSIAGRYGVNSQGQVLQRMQIEGHIPRHVGFGADHLQQQQTSITALAAKQSPPTQPTTGPTASSKQQVEPQNKQDQVKPKATAASESKVSDYLTSTPNMMMLPLQQRSSLPRMA